MSYYGPKEGTDTIFFEKTCLGGIFLTGVGYGMQLILYINCARYLWQERNRRGRVMLFLLAYTTCLLGLSSLWVSVATWTVEDIYINNRNYPGGPWSYFLATQNLPEDIIFIIGIFVLTFLSDLLMIWRCWVIWSAHTCRPLTYVVVAIPFFALLGSLALGIIWILNSSLPGLSLYSKIPLVFGTAYYVTSLGLNIAVTILITFRLVSHRRTMLESLPPDYATQYLSIAGIVVESAALYSVIGLGFIISYALQNPMNQIFLGILPLTQQVAGYLIILRRRVCTDNLAGTNATAMQLTTIRFRDRTTIDQGSDSHLSLGTLK